MPWLSATNNFGDTAVTDAGKGERSGTGKAPLDSLHGTQIETAVPNLHPREERERGRDGERERESTRAMDTESVSELVGK